MRKIIIYLIILLIPVFLDGQRCFINAASLAKSEKAEELEKEKTNEIDSAKQDEEDYQAYIKTRKLLNEKLAKRTKECWGLLDGLFFTVNSHARKATEAKDFNSEKEFIEVLSDYNSVLGDLGLMQVILDLGKFVSEDKFIEYYALMESGFERLKDSFSFKNELFLSRIAKLKNSTALRYEKQLFRHYQDYFVYDLRLDKINEPQDIEQEQKK